MMNCVIVDDEPLARQVLENYIGRHGDLQLAGSCANALDAHRLLLHTPVDVVFLDIKMPLINGLQFLRSLKDPPPIVFTTAFAEHAAESYELDAIDYLLKPFSYERFCRSIEKLMKHNASDRPGQGKDYFFVKADQQLVKIAHDEIMYIEARKDYLKIVLPHSQLITHMTMKYITSLLPAEDFIRIHRSYIVPVKKVSATGKGMVRLGELELPVGDHYRREIQDAIKKQTGGN